MKFLLEIWLNFDDICWQFIEYFSSIGRVLSDESFVADNILFDFRERIVKLLNAIKIFLMNILFLTA